MKSIPDADRELVAAVVAWYERARRDLPWRRTRDPYAVWVSEIMLQQTRVDTAVPYYERFMASFPSIERLADADLDAVLKHWAGLGYYSRARNLHAAAREVVKRHDGRVPSGEAELLALPGVGRYTAGAIRSIAFHEPAPLVDGNVARVLSRLYALEEDPAGAAGKARLWALAGRLVPAGSAASSWNQGLMELGATICTPRAPACHRCPVSPRCRGRERAAELPRTAPGKAVPERVVDVLALRRRGRWLVAQRPARGLWGGLWELPARASLADPPAGEPAGEVVHVLSHLRMRFRLRVAAAPAGRIRPSGYDRARWLHRGALDAGEVPLSTAARRVLALLPTA